MRNGSITFADALKIATAETARVISASERLSQYQFGEVVLERENEWHWTFVSPSEELIAQGRVPGGIHVCVDKRDGHIWNWDEMENFYLALLAAEEKEKTDLTTAAA